MAPQFYLLNCKVKRSESKGVPHEDDLLEGTQQSTGRLEGLEVRAWAPERKIIAGNHWRPGGLDHPPESELPGAAVMLLQQHKPVKGQRCCHHGDT